MVGAHPAGPAGRIAGFALPLVGGPAGGGADRLVQRGAKVYFYEDFPYVLKEGAREARLQELGGAFELALVEMSEMLSLRIEAAGIYASQVAANFGDRASMQKAMQNYTHSIRPIETVHLERYWTPR